jgi:hypothetical protein
MGKWLLIKDLEVETTDWLVNNIKDQKNHSNLWMYTQTYNKKDKQRGTCLIRNHQKRNYIIIVLCITTENLSNSGIKAIFEDKTCPKEWSETNQNQLYNFRKYIIHLLRKVITPETIYKVKFLIVTEVRKVLDMFMVLKCNRHMGIV